MMLHSLCSIALILFDITAGQTVTPTITNSAQFSSIISAKYSAYTYCSRLLLTCQPTVTSCAQSLCASCTTIGQTGINRCCASGLPAAVDCFVTQIADGGPNVYTSGQSQPPAPTPTFTQSQAVGFQACANISRYSSLCESLSPGFVTQTVFPFQAPCLCYNSNNMWDPDTYDNWVSECDSYLSISTDYTAPCRTAGDVESRNSEYTGTASTTANPTLSSTSTSRSQASTNAPFQASYLWVFPILCVVLLL